jgi:hypothetical protein
VAVADTGEGDLDRCARNLAAHARARRALLGALLGALRELCDGWAKRAQTRTSGSDSYRQGAADAWDTAVAELGSVLVANRVWPNTSRSCGTEAEGVAIVGPGPRLVCSLDTGHDGWHITTEGTRFRERGPS